MGNGNLGVVVVNPINTMTFLLGKNEFWSLSGGQVEPMASMALSIPGMSGASFAMQQNIYTGTVTGQFTLSGNEIQTNSWVSSNDTTNNFLFTQFTYSGSGTQAVTVSMAAGNGNTYPTSSGSSGSVLYYNVAADSTATVGGYNTHQVRVAAGVVGATGTISGSTLHFTLSPGTTVTLVSSIMSNYDSSSYTTQSISNVSGSTTSSISSELSANEAWWASFWDASYVEFANNPVLQKQYYGSLYLLASASEPNQAPPGLWGNWVETTPSWAGDYTMDYNYEVPFLASFPTNHVTLADSYDTPVINWLPDAESNATNNGYTGAYYQCHIGPLPNGSYETGTGEENIKFNGAYAATVMLEHYYVTQSPTYAATIWPTISEIATFWQNYLTWNGTSYDDLDDAQQENDPYPQTDGTMSLGLIRNVLQGAINLSIALGESPSQRSTWQTELNELTTFNGLPYPTFTQDGLQVFEWTSVGRQWNVGNSIGIQHIYPGNAIGLGSSSTLLTVAKNMITEMGSGTYGDGWTDQNGTNTFYPAAARVGYTPSTILSNLTNWVNNQAMPSFWINTNGGGVEGFNTVPSTLSEMMMQSFQGNIIVFPNWPSGTNAHFGDNLAYGNFLVSSAILNNAVLYVRLISQAGQTISITNPWPGQSAQFYRNGTNEGTLSGTTFSITTSTDDVILLGPSGVSDETINSEMEETLAGLTSGGSGGSEGPYNGIPAAIPGTVLAENYDTGGSGIGYYVTSVNGTDNSYRSDGVDLETASAPATGNDIGWTSTGQWFHYTVNVATAGTYNVTFEVAAPSAVTDGFHIANSSGTNLSGSVNIPATGGWQTWTTVTASVTLPAGQQVLTIYQDNGGWNIDSAVFAAVGEAPYGGTPAGIPGTVMAENYDTGGQGVGYYVTSVNGTDNGYRSDGVDLETASAPATGNDVGWSNTGQWFRYTVSVAAAGTYNVTFLVAAPSAVTDAFHIANSSGTNLSGSVNIPATGGYQTWTTTTASVTLPAGTQTLTLYQDNGSGNWNIDSAVFAATSLPYNVNAIYTNGSTFPSTGGADREGDAFSPTLLGATQAFNGTTFTYGPSNAPDAFSNNVTIPLSAGSFSSLNILAYAVAGSQPSQTFTIHYTDGTTTTDTQGISDWGIPAGYSGETQVAKTAYRNTYTGGESSAWPAYVYGYTLAANSAKTVSSLTIPANADVIVLGVQDQQ
jgi:uncharacterized protein involved in high-affinity Fe2+ transport